MSDYLLDTDTFIFLLKHHPTVEAKARAVGMGRLALSAVSVTEVLHGAYYSANPSASLMAIRALIAQLAVITLDQAIADKFGEIKADLRRQGQILADFDLLIGATALVAGRILVTNNTKHFQRLGAYGLVIENWVV